MRTLGIAVLVGAAGRAALAQTGPFDKQLIAARDTVWRAYFSNDTAALRRYIPAAAATAEGVTDLRWSTRADIMAGARRFAESKSKLVDLAFSNTSIVYVAHTALVHANYRYVTESAGRRDTSVGRATELFVRQGSTWTNPYWQLEYNARGAEREIPLPDTLGANFAIGDSAKKAGTLGDYDTLIGTWEFRFQSRRPDGTFEPAYSGHWTFEKRAGGGLVEDRWRPDDASSPMGLSLYTSRLFDHERKVWQMTGSWSEGGTIQPGLTWSDGTYRFAIQHGDGVISRIRYLSIEADGFLWRSDTSRDGGKTWLLDAGTMIARRIGK